MNNQPKLTSHLKTVQKSNKDYLSRPKTPPPLIQVSTPKVSKSMGSNFNEHHDESDSRQILTKLNETEIEKDEVYEEASELDLEIEQPETDDEVENDFNQNNFNETLKENLNKLKEDDVYGSQVDSPPMILDFNSNIDTESPVESHLTLDHYELPSNILDYFITKKINSLFQWQYEAIHCPGVLEGGHLIINSPTSSGKTMIPDILCFRTILKRQKKVLIVLPFISLANEKVLNLETMLKFTSIRVGGFMGNCLPAGRLPAVDIAVCTIEKANNIINRLIQDDKLSELGMVIVDELHEIGTERGTLLEQLLTKIKYHDKLNKNEIQIIGMSATLPNAEEIAEWLNAASYKTEFRPVPLSEMIKDGNNIIDVKTQKTIREYKDVLIRIGEDTTGALSLALETILSGSGVLVFCEKKDLTSSFAELLAKKIKELENFSRQEEMFKNFREAKEKLKTVLNQAALDELKSQLSKCPSQLDKVLERTLSSGVAFHHSGLTTEERDIIESGFKDGFIKCIFATPTLSAGVNLPARRVIINSLKIGIDKLSKLTYQQMKGRAGRKGIDTYGESILICESGKREECNLLTDNKLEPVTSKIVQLDKDGKLIVNQIIRRTVLEVIANGLVKTFEEIKSYLNSTFFAKQVRELADDEIKSILNNLCASTEENIIPSVQSFKDKDSEIYQASKLGQGILASSFQPDEAVKMLKEIKRAMKGLALDTEIHLLYLVISNSILERKDVSWDKYESFFLKILYDKDNSYELINNVAIKLLGLDFSYIQAKTRYNNIRNETEENREKRLKYVKFYYALALNEIMNEKPLHEISEKYSISKSDLQMLQQRTSSFCGMLHIFCKKLGYNLMSMITKQFKDRLYFGISSDLIELMDIPCLNSQIARCLYDNNFKDVKSIAHSTKFDIEKCLLNYFLGKDEIDANGKTKKVWVPIRCKSMDESEIAELILKEARNVIEENAGGRIEWSQDDSIAIRTIDTTQVSQSQSRNSSPQKPNRTRCRVYHKNDRSFQIDGQPNRTLFKTFHEPRSPSKSPFKSPTKSNKRAHSESSDEYPASFISSPSSTVKSSSTCSSPVKHRKLSTNLDKNLDINEKLSSTVVNLTALADKSDMFSQSNQQSSIECDFSSRKDDSSFIIPETNPINSVEISIKDEDKSKRTEMDTTETFNVELTNNESTSMHMNSNRLLNSTSQQPSTSRQQPEPITTTAHYSEQLNSGILTNLSSDQLSSQNCLSDASLPASTNSSQFQILSQSPVPIRDMEMDLFPSDDEEDTDLEIKFESIQSNGLQSSNDTSIRVEKTISKLNNKLFYESTYNKEVDNNCFKIVNKRAKVICDEINGKRFNHVRHILTESKIANFVKKFANSEVFLIYFKMEEMLTIETDFLSGKSKKVQDIKVVPEFIDKIEAISISFGDEKSTYHMNKSEIEEFRRHIKEKNFMFKRDLVTGIAFDAKFCYKLLKCCFGMSTECLKHIYWHDPKVAHWLLNSDIDEVYDIVEIAEEYLKSQINNSKVFIEKRINKHTNTMEVNCLNRLMLLFPVMSRLKQLLIDKKLYESYINIELPVMMVFADMELSGFILDTKYLRELNRKCQKLISKYETMIITYNKTRYRSLNLRNTRHVKELLKSNDLYTKYLKKFNLPSTIVDSLSTNKEMLIKMMELDHELPGLIVDFRKLYHVSDQIAGFIKEYSESSSTIMGTYKHYMATGRIAMFNPNLLGVDKDFTVKLKDEEHQISLKRSFTGKPGYILVTADYCQIELRILAALSKEKNLLDVFQKGQDPFKLIAARLHNVDVSAVTPFQRNSTKQIIYSIIYGKGVKSLAEDLEVHDEKIAQEFLDEFHGTFQNIKPFVNSTKEYCREYEYIETLFGRRRYIPNINSNIPKDAASGERKAVNSRIQGSASDLVKLTMLKLDAALEKEQIDAELLLQIHDELIFQVKDDEETRDKFIKILVEEMESCSSVLKTKQFEVKLEIKVKCGPNWGQLDDYDISSI